VTFCGQSPASPASRSVHSASVVFVAANSRSRQRERRQPRAVQDLVGVRVADAAEEARVGQRALDGVVLGDQPRGERVACRRHDVDAARVERSERFTPLDDMERCAPLLARLGERERAAGKGEERERVRRRRLAALEPAQPSGDHEMDDDEEVAFERQHDALAEPLDPDDELALDRRDRRRHRAEQERVTDRDALETLADGLGGEPLDVDGDVGELGHRGSVPSRAAHLSGAAARATPVVRTTPGIRQLRGGGVASTR